MEWINFSWHGDSVGAKYYDRLEIMIPLKIENLPYNFYAQFDLGAFRTQLYENSFWPYLRRHKELAKKLDNKYERYDGVQCNSFQNLTLHLGNVTFSNREVMNHVNYGDYIPTDSVNTPTPKRIGTIGLDLFTDKILIIDYPKKRIAVTENLPHTIKASFVDMKFEDSHIKIPVTINGSDEYILFDTGSSNWELVTSEDNWRKIANTDPSALDSLEGSTSWGRKHKIWWSNCTSEIIFGGKAISNINVYYGPSWIVSNSWLQKEKILGITGNRLFWDGIVIIDFKHYKFGFQKCHGS
jgi:hypothetical protein